MHPAARRCVGTTLPAAESYCRSLASARSVATAGNEGVGEHRGPLLGARVSNRSALALISLALDEVDSEARLRRLE